MNPMLQHQLARRHELDHEALVRATTAAPRHPDTARHGRVARRLGWSLIALGRHLAGPELSPAELGRPGLRGQGLPRAHHGAFPTPC